MSVDKSELDWSWVYLAVLDAVNEDKGTELLLVNSAKLFEFFFGCIGLFLDIIFSFFTRVSYSGSDSYSDNDCFCFEALFFLCDFFFFVFL